MLCIRLAQLLAIPRALQVDFSRHQYLHQGQAARATLPVDCLTAGATTAW